jgi:6-phosphogluconolactonase
MGRKPRNFMVVPGGKFVLVANQETDDFRVFSRNAADGRLQPTGTVVSVGSPVCLKLLQVAR